MSADRAATAARPPAGVLVHNSDGVNPYAAELATLLLAADRPVTLVDASNSLNPPGPAVRWRRLLPATFAGRSPLRQVASLVQGVSVTAWASLVRRDVVLVSFTRFPLEDLVLAGLAYAGRPVVLVVHNPEPREAESRLARVCRRALLKHATVPVVHAERLRARVDPIARHAVTVCPHPPYVATVGSASAGVELDPHRTWVAFIGALRWDKGADLLAEVLTHVPHGARGGLGLVVCGRGTLPNEDWQRIRALGIEVLDLTSARPVPQEVLLDVLRSRPLVLAPYVAATQSGSIVLALSLGCRVLAFDEGGIADVLTPDGLVRAGDVAAMGRAIGDGRGGTTSTEVPEWMERCVVAWAGAVELAGQRAGSRPSARRAPAGHPGSSGHATQQTATTSGEPA